MDATTFTARTVQCRVGHTGLDGKYEQEAMVEAPIASTPEEARLLIDNNVISALEFCAIFTKGSRLVAQAKAKGKVSKASSVDIRFAQAVAKLDNDDWAAIRELEDEGKMMPYDAIHKYLGEKRFPTK